MTKRLRLVALLAILLMAMVLPAGAAPNVTVKIDGTAVSFPDQKPYIDSNNRTLVPMRAPMETMGATVDWNNDTRQAIFEKNGTTVVFTIGSTTYTVNGVKKTMDTQAIITGDRTCIPIRYAAEAIGARVDWDHNTYTVLISTTPSEVKTVVQEKPTVRGDRESIKVGDYNIRVTELYNRDFWFAISDANRPNKDIRVVCTSHPEWNNRNCLMWDATHMVLPQDVWTDSFAFLKEGYTPEPKSGDVVTFDIYGKVNGQETQLLTLTKTLP